MRLNDISRESVVQVTVDPADSTVLLGVVQNPHPDLERIQGEKPKEAQVWLSIGEAADLIRVLQAAITLARSV